MLLLMSIIWLMVFFPEASGILFWMLVAVLVMTFQGVDNQLLGELWTRGAATDPLIT
jgi:hypothetical protein